MRQHIPDIFFTKELFIVVISLLFSYVLRAQPKEETLKLARAGYDLEQQGKLSEALFKYNQCIAADPKYPYPVQRIASMYHKLKNYPKAVQFYQRAIALDSSFDDYNYLNLALCYKQMKKFDSSLYAYRTFTRKMKPVLKEDTTALQDAIFFTNYLERSRELREQPRNTDDPEPVAALNSEFWDFAPSIRADGKMLVFTSRRPSTNNQKLTDTKDFGDDIFYSLKDSSGNWSVPKAVAPPVNSVDDEGVSSLAIDGQSIYYSICRRPDGVGDCDLYYSELKGTILTQPKNLGRTVNSPQWDGQPSISADGNQLYFSSRRRGSLNGSEDIWVTYRNTDGSWTVPMNLGETVNTPMSERSPFIAADGKTLYFSSNGHPGHGDHDLFVTRKQEDGTWSIPENLGSPINTSSEDEYLTIPARGNKIYYSSEQGGSDYNIYEAILPSSLQPAPVTLVVGHVYDKFTKKPIGAKLEVTNLAKDELLASYNSNSESGEFYITFPMGFEYGVTATAQNYAFFSEHYTPPDTAIFKEISYDIYLTPIDTNLLAGNTGANDGDSVTVIPLNNIFFDFNKATLRDESTTELKNIVKFLKEYPKLKIEISGHTDSVGTATYNKNLSEQRANAVRDYIVKNGIAASRITAKGYGATKPIAANDTEENKQKNRRTEFRILNKKK